MDWLQKKISGGTGSGATFQMFKFRDAIHRLGHRTGLSGLERDCQLQLEVRTVTLPYSQSSASLEVLQNIFQLSYSSQGMLYTEKKYCVAMYTAYGI